MRLIGRFAILGAALLPWGSSQAQSGVVTQRILSLEAAQIIAGAAHAACASRGLHTTAAVIHRSRNGLALLRDEQADPATIDMARGKAYTALVFRGPTSEFQKATASDPARAPQRDVPGILARGGGGPVAVGDEIIGAVG